jgi:hypothetical protein
MHMRKPFSTLTLTLTLALALAATLALTAASAVAASAPTVSTGGSAHVTYSSAVVYGSVDPQGAQTTYVFQYGTTRGYALQTPLAPVGAGTSAVHVSQTLSGLAPLTTYYYRILASNGSGAHTGTGGTFKTTAVPLSLSIAGAPNPVTFGEAFFIDGTLSGTGAADHAIELQANAFPYTQGFRAVGNAELTNASGGFSFPYLGLLENAQLRVVTIGKPKVSSAILQEDVAVRVSLHVRATRRHGFARLYGTVAPAEPGALVGFQLLRPGRSLNQGGTVVEAGTLGGVSSFSRVVRVRRGLYEALVRVFDGAHVSAYSRPVLIR